MTEMNRRHVSVTSFSRFKITGAEGTSCIRHSGRVATVAGVWEGMFKKWRESRRYSEYDRHRGYHLFELPVRHVRHD